VTLTRIRARACDTFGRANVLTVVLLLLAVLPLAQASPPDPTWIVGIYDDADLYEAFAAVADGSALIERGALTDKAMFVVRDGVQTPDVPANASSGSVRGIGIRAPPAPFALA
jgi:hypothetical protein